MIRRLLADDMAAHPHWWQMFGVFCVLFAAIVASFIILTGCGAPCSDHGGVRWTNAKVYQCNDGTWE